MEKFIDSVRPKDQNKREEKAFMKAQINVLKKDKNFFKKLKAKHFQ